MNTSKGDNATAGHPSSIGCLRCDCENRIPPDCEPGMDCLHESTALNLTVKIQRSDSWDDLIRVAVGGIHELCDAVSVSWLEMNGRVPTTLWRYSVPSGEVQQGKVHFDEQLFFSKMGNVFFTQVGSFLQTASNKIYFIQDCFYKDELEQTSYFTNYMSPNGVKDIICTQLYFNDPGNVVILTIALNERKKFNRSNVDVLHDVLEHIRSACRQFSRMANFSIMTEVLKSYNSGSSKVGTAIIGQNASKLWDVDSERSQDLIRELGGFHDEAGQMYLPQCVSEWVKRELHANVRVVAMPADIVHEFKSWRGGSIQIRLLMKSTGQGGVLVFTKIPASTDQECVTEYPHFKLSSRELDVARYLVAGMVNKEISHILSISHRTVEKHISRILEKLGVEHRQGVHDYFANYQRLDRVDQAS